MDQSYEDLTAFENTNKDLLIKYFHLDIDEFRARVQVSDWPKCSMDELKEKIKCKDDADVYYTISNSNLDNFKNLHFEVIKKFHDLCNIYNKDYFSQLCDIHG